MPYRTIILEKESGVAILTLNRPDVMHAWNLQMAEETVEAIDEVSHDETVRVLIITATGRAFSAGADMGRMKKIADGEVKLEETGPGRVMLGKTTLSTVVSRVRSLGKPVIVAVNGVAAGAGLSVVMAGDMRIASDDARFTMSFVKRGTIPDCGGTYLLPRLVGPGMAAKLMFTGDVIDAREAGRIGLVDQLVPPEELMKVTKELAQRIAQNPPLSLKMGKQALYKGMNETDLKSQMEYEMYVNIPLTKTEDFKEGVRSFLEKREPVFKGR